MVKEPLVDRVPLLNQTTFKNSLQPGYSEGSDHNLQGPRWHLYLSIAGILKLLLASGLRNGDWSRSGSEKLDGREVAPLPYPYKWTIIQTGSVPSSWKKKIPKFKTGFINYQK
jgi:hypothetical protein